MDNYQIILETLENATNEAFLKIQEKEGITDGGLDPFLSVELDNLTEKLASHVLYCTKWQKAKGEPKALKVIHSELDYTGGGSWCTWGELEDHTIFVSGNNEGFAIYDKAILDKVVVSDDWRVAYDIYDATADMEAIRYTDDLSDETFDMWLQVYEQNKAECCDLEWLLDDLYEYHHKTRPQTEEK